METSIPSKKSALEKLFTPITEVRAGEGTILLLMTLNVFLLLTAYYIVKPVREGLIIAGAGAEIKTYASFLHTIILLFLVPAYAWLAGKVPRRVLINIVSIFFIACLFFFYFWVRMEVESLKAVLGISFFSWVGIFNLMIIAQFWSYANDIYSEEAGKRLFVVMVIGQNLGAVLGSFIVRSVIGGITAAELLLVAAILLGISVFLTNWVEARKTGGRPVNDSKKTDEDSMKSGGAFRLVFSSKYLLLIAFLMLTLNWANTLGEYILSKTVSGAASEAVTSGLAAGLSVRDYITKFYGDFFGVVNLMSFLLQLFLVSPSHSLLRNSHCSFNFFRWFLWVDMH